jgi:hypothetical protein
MSVTKLPRDHARPLILHERTIEGARRPILYDSPVGRFAALADGTVSLEQNIEAADTTWVWSMSAEQCSELVRSLLKISYTARERTKRLRGADQWVPSPGPDGTIRVTHDDRTRVFRKMRCRGRKANGPPTVHLDGTDAGYQRDGKLYSRDCVVCRIRMFDGDECWVDAHLEPRHEWWGGIALCLGCAQPRPTGLRAVK